MSLKGTIGKVAVNRDEHNVDWIIDSIFSFSGENDYYYSPDFELSDNDWRFKIEPNGKGGWISLYLCLIDPVFKQGATFFCGVKKCDGKADRRRSNLSWIFYEDNDEFGYSEFLQRSELVTRKIELAPADTFTITCTLWGYDDFDSTARISTLSNNLLDLFISEKAADVTLHVKNESFSAHKAVLVARSPVFEAMFEVPMKEKTTGIVDIKDCDPDAFKDFLIYVYSGKLQGLSSHAFELYKIAHMYETEELESACIIIMMDKISVDTICESAVLADTYDEAGLWSKVEHFFNINYEDVFCTREWENLLGHNPLLANKLLKGMAEFWRNP